MTVSNARTMLITRARLVKIAISCIRLKLIKNKGVVLVKGPINRQVALSINIKLK